MQSENTRGSETEKDKGPKPKGELKVTVTYVAARKPFKTDAAPTMTIGELKAAALEAFGLAEGPTPDGLGTITFTLYHEAEPQTDLGLQIGTLAGNAHSIAFKLVKQIEQG